VPGEKFAIAGTLVNRAPELLYKDAKEIPDDIGILLKDSKALGWLGDRCDIWSLGVCLFELATGKLWLRDVDSGSDVPAAVSAINVAELCHRENIEPGLANLLVAMLERDLRKRPSAAQLLRDPYFQIAESTNTFFVSPLSRLEANYDDSMMHPLWFYRAVLSDDYSDVRWSMATLFMHSYRTARHLISFTDEQLGYLRPHLTDAAGNMTLVKFLSSNRVVSHWYRGPTHTPEDLIETYKLVTMCPIWYTEAGNVKIKRVKESKTVFVVTVNTRKYHVEQSGDELVFKYEDHDYRIARLSNVFDHIRMIAPAKK
jgi:serine/threonine protein kinase